MQRFHFPAALALALLVACGGDAAQTSAESGGGSAAPTPAMAANAAPPAQQTRSASAQAATAPAAVSAPASAPARNRRLETFDTQALFWSMYHHAGVEPPIRDWVASTWQREARDRGEVVDEFFDREAFLDRLETELRPAYEAAHDIGFARIPMRGELGTYDTQFEELYIEPFAPGSGVRAYSSELQRETRLQFSNALDVYAWPMSAAEARDLIERLPTDFMGRRNRAILLEVDVKLTGATIDPRTGNGHIDAEITRYQLFAQGPGGGRGELLREVTDIR